uniref:Uncharacterized protein n=1 Tax=Leersia perrieri TaxID=77586 RepID=A0A0D9VZG2_9ORYZ
MPQQPRPFLPEEPVRHVLLRPRENPRVLGRHRLVPKQHLPFPHLVPIVMALHHHVTLRPPVLHRHGRLDPQRLVHRRLHKRHLRQRLHAHLPSVLPHRGAHLRREPPVHARPGPAQPLHQRREQNLHSTKRVEAEGEQHVVDGLLARHAEPIRLVEDAAGSVAEEFREAVVVFPHERRREAERVEQRVLDEGWEAEAEEWTQLEKHPLCDQLRPVTAQR